MKRILIFLSILLVACTISAQDFSQLVQPYALGFSLNQHTFGSAKDSINGLVMELNITYEHEKHLYSISYLSGRDYTKYDYGELALSYGRKIITYKRFSLEGFAGLGLFSRRQMGQKRFSETAESFISLPIKIVPKIRIGDSFGLGLNFGYDYNRVKSFYTFGLRCFSYHPASRTMF